MNINNLITVKSAADLVGVSTTRIYTLNKEGKIKATIIDGIKFFNRHEVAKIKTKKNS